MSESVETELYLLMDIDGITAEMDEGLLAACQEAAELLVSDAEKRFKSKTAGSGTGEMEAGFFDFKSKFENGGWVAGVFGTPGEWEESIAGRAHFFEYGRSAPGSGKKSAGKPQPIRQRAQRPRPFLRPARNKVKREFGGITGRELRTVARKLNRSKSLDRQVMRVANRVK